MSFFLSFLLFVHIFCNNISNLYEKGINVKNLSKNSNNTNLMNDFNNLVDKNGKRKLDNRIPIRIAFNSQFNFLPIDHPGLLESLNKALSKVQNALKDLIRVDYLGNIQLYSNAILQLNNSGFDVNKKNYENTDLVIFIRDKSVKDKQIAELGIVQRIDNVGRPTVGFIILNLNNIENIGTNRQNEELMSIIILHEVTHILGFTRSILKEKNFLKTINTNRINNSPLTKLSVNSSKALDEAKKYFQCNNITEIEIDNKTFLESEEYIHWEGRLLLGDYMSSDIYYQEQVISEITLALLEDLGWYDINYYTGGLMKFGKYEGCNFINKDCINGSSIIPPFPNQFCNNELYGTCSSGRLSRGHCDIYFWPSQIDVGYKRSGYTKKISTINIGYGSAISEYCPKSTDLKTLLKENEHYIGSCFIGNDNYGNVPFKDDDDSYYYFEFDNAFYEEINNNSYCAFSSLLYKNDNNDIYKGVIRPTCYTMNCSNTSLTIKINSEYIVCPREGGIIRINESYSQYSGILYCPEYHLICSGKVQCNNLFDCIEKKSEAKADYSQIKSSIQIKNKESEITETTKLGYENTEGAICPVNCSQCKDYQQCILCRDNFYYIGTKENDENPIICKDTPPPLIGYYISTSPNYAFNRTYFQCIDHCYKCHGDKIGECQICEPTHKVNGSKVCEERIPYCLTYNTTYYEPNDPTNGGGKGYKECLECDNSNNYYCVNGTKSKCEKVDDYNSISYYNMEDKPFPCIRKCSHQYYNCKECNRTQCIKCKEDKNYIFNNYGHCIEKIDNCDIQNMNVNESKCSNCSNQYYCLENKYNVCSKVDNIDYYYKINYNPVCYERCSKKLDNCLKCENENKCTQCVDGYFVYNGKCIKNIEGCLSHFYDGTIKECLECDENKGYYCINKTKSICHKRDTPLKPYYYLLPEIDYNCYNICDTLVENCLQCNQTICYSCTQRYIINDNGTYCFVKPFDIPDDDKCMINYIPYNKSIFEIDPWDYADYYWLNIPYVSKVDHYVGENYTITVFTNPDCTEILLNDGYYKIDSNDLQKNMIKEAKIEGMKIVFSVFINYNHKNHFSYYDLETKYLVPNKYCPSCVDINYNVTNKINYTLNNVLGSVVTNLIISEKIEFIDRDSDIYNDICKNVTFFGIDLPLKKRLNYLYLHNYTELILCNAENCTLAEYEYENYTITCKCKFGNKFEEILNGEKSQFSPYEGQPTESNNDFIDSIEIIKCSINGFKSKNIKANIGFFISIIAIAGQIILFIYYCIFSKSIVNLNKKIMSSPPKKKNFSNIMIITDWERNTRENNKINDENEVYVQSRDDAEDQLLEEEKSYSKDIFDASSLSIDTNVGGAIRNISTGNKNNIKEKADNKRVLILLSNKGKNKTKNIQEDLISDSDIIPLEEDKKLEAKKYIKIYWYVLSLKQHIINYFSDINCCKITESYIPISIRLIRSIFMIILTFVLNILWLNQTYYENKFEYFNNEYKFIYTQVENKVPTGKRFSYAFSNTFIKGILSFVILLVVQFLIGFIFFSVRNNVIKAKRQNNDDAIQDVVSCTLKKYIIFFIINLALMIIFLMTLTGFCGAYGGGFVDYFIASIISLIFLEIFPFLWSIVIALFIYFGYKKDIKLLKKISHFFMF